MIPFFPTYPSADKTDVMVGFTVSIIKLLFFTFEFAVVTSVFSDWLPTLSVTIALIFLSKYTFCSFKTVSAGSSNTAVLSLPTAFV